jgi:Zn-dependent peptidase ImmA (M78 family)
VALLRRGFKTWCENTAHGYRRSLGLDRYGALDPKLLAKSQGVAIWKPEEMEGLDPKVLHHLVRVDADSWSAVTLKVGQQAVIIVNSSHKLTRENSDLAHEMAHIILKHEPAQMFVSADGKMMISEYNAVHEEEAQVFSGTLLVPREALQHMMARGLDDAGLAKHFVVSQSLITMRKNVTGLNKRRG